MSGGTTDRASQPGGNEQSSGKPGEERAVRKSSGVPQNYPTEFREALENYYRFLDLGYKLTALGGSDFPWCGRGLRPCSCT